MSKKTDQDIIAEAIESYIFEGGVPFSVLDRPDATDDDITKGLESINYHAVAAYHPNLKAHHIDHALSSPRVQTNAAVIVLKNNALVKPHHIDKALEHPHSAVRFAALKHPTAVRTHHIQKALSDSHPDIRSAAEELLSKTAK
jgi:hypothetical protein